VTFAVGDRVRVVSTRTAYKEYVGVTGVVKALVGNTTHVVPDVRVRGDGNSSHYTFSKASWTLEREGPLAPEPYEEWFK